MELIADILLIAGALGAALYCHVLARRLNRFTNLEKGVGGAVAVLSAQVDDMTKTLSQAQGTASGSTLSLEALTNRAEEVAKRLELLVASMHDLPSVTDQPAGPAPETATEPEPPAPEPEPEPAPEPEPTVSPEPVSLFRSARADTPERAA
jgi:hypothetical protein